MKLDELTRYDKEMNKTKMVYGLITLCAVLSLPVMYYLSLQQVKEISNSGFVADPSYKSFYVTRRELTATERAYQFENHAKETWESMWNVDKSSFKDKMDIALERSDQSAEMIYKEYFIEKGLEAKIKESNWLSELTVLDVKVDMNVSPPTGRLTSRWAIIRPGGSDVRHLDITFEVQDAGISAKNPYGARLKNIQIYDNTRFTEPNSN